MSSTAAAITLSLTCHTLKVKCWIVGAVFKTCASSLSFPCTGIETFPGRVMHTHDFKKGKEYKGEKFDHELT